MSLGERKNTEDINANSPEGVTSLCQSASFSRVPHQGMSCIEENLTGLKGVVRYLKKEKQKLIPNYGGAYLVEIKRALSQRLRDKKA